MRPRLFDLIGALCVIAWIAILLTFTAQRLAQSAQDTANPLQDQAVRLSEGQAWMILTRQLPEGGDEEVGYIHEARTRVDQGWLFEYELTMILEIAGTRRLIETHTRATLDEQAYLDQFQADIDSFMGSFSVKGDVSPTQIDLTMNLGGGPSSRTIPLQERPRLSNTAINQLIARPELLVAGTRYEREYFDPITQKMSAFSYLYMGEADVDVFETPYHAYHFRQQLMGDEFDVYISPQGDVLIQEFPMNTVASLLPEALGKTRVSSLQRTLKSKKNDASSKETITVDTAQIEALQPKNLGVQGALKRLGDLIAPKEREAPDASPDIAPDLAPDLFDAPADLTPPPTAQELAP